MGEPAGASQRDHIHDPDPRVSAPPCWCGWHRPWTADEAIGEAWRFAGDSDCCGVTWAAACDQPWRGWRVTVTCSHGSYSGVSNGPVNASVAFTGAVEKFIHAHSREALAALEAESTEGG